MHTSLISLVSSSPRHWRSLEEPVEVRTWINCVTPGLTSHRMCYHWTLGELNHPHGTWKQPQLQSALPAKRLLSNFGQPETQLERAIMGPTSKGLRNLRQTGPSYRAQHPWDCNPWRWSLQCWRCSWGGMQNAPS